MLDGRGRQLNVLLALVLYSAVFMECGSVILGRFCLKQIVNDKTTTATLLCTAAMQQSWRGEGRQNGKQVRHDSSGNVSEMAYRLETEEALVWLRKKAKKTNRRADRWVGRVAHEKERGSNTCCSRTPGCRLLELPRSVTPLQPTFLPSHTYVPPPILSSSCKTTSLAIYWYKRWMYLAEASHVASCAML